MVESRQNGCLPDLSQPCSGWDPNIIQNSLDIMGNIANSTWIMSNIGTAMVFLIPTIFFWIPISQFRLATVQPNQKDLTLNTNTNSNLDKTFGVNITEPNLEDNDISNIKKRPSSEANNIFCLTKHSWRYRVPPDYRRANPLVRRVWDSVWENDFCVFVSDLRLLYAIQMNVGYI